MAIRSPKLYVRHPVNRDVGHKKGNMNLRIASIVLTMSIACVMAKAIEPEPNWSSRYEEILRVALLNSKPPKTGSQITLMRRVGSPITGKLEAVSTNAVTVNGFTYNINIFAQQTLDTLYPDIYVKKMASIQLRNERKEYLARKASEDQMQERQQIEARQAEAEAMLNAQKAEQKRTRLGETPEEFTSRFGEPIERQVSNEDEQVLTYIKSEINMAVTFIKQADGAWRSSCIVYQKITDMGNKPLNGEIIKALLEANAGGNSWQSADMMSAAMNEEDPAERAAKINRYANHVFWMRSDSMAVAEYNEMTDRLGIYTAAFGKRAQAKQKQMLEGF